MASKVHPQVDDALDAAQEGAGDIAVAAQEGAGDIAVAVQEGAGDIAFAVQEGAGDIAVAVQEVAGDIPGAVQEGAGDIAAAVQEGAGDIADAAMPLWEDADLDEAYTTTMEGASEIADLLTGAAGGFCSEYLPDLGLVEIWRDFYQLVALFFINMKTTSFQGIAKNLGIFRCNRRA
jgi:hypothetical protein